MRFKKDPEININMAIPLFRDVSEVDNILIRDAIDDKIDQTIKQLSSLKFPGPDGMNILFYQKVLAHSW